MDRPLPPAALPPPGSSERWRWLQQLRRQRILDLEPWLAALEDGMVAAETDLISVLAERLDQQSGERFLAWWLADAASDPALLPLIGRTRSPGCAQLLRQALAERHSPVSRQPLLSLLGHQRDPRDFPLLMGLALDPGPLDLRLAALEGLAVGLSAWPLPQLQTALRQLAADLQVPVAAEAVDLLARLPRGRWALAPLRSQALDPAVEDRLRRRWQALEPCPLLLIVHGRAGGVIPAEWQTLARELEQGRGGPVRIHALTADDPPAPGCFGPRAGVRRSVPILVPLFLLPGSHVRTDVPAIARSWRAEGALCLLPFLGAWPRFQRALAAHSADVLLHHPVEGRLAARYLDHLQAVTQANVLATPYSAADVMGLKLANHTDVLPLALAANRLTDSLPEPLGLPLMARPRFRELLLDELMALP